jgi:hypothetical protein
MTRVEWSLTRRLRAKSLPSPRRGLEDHGGKPARILWQVLARGSDGCPPVSRARAPCLTFCTPGWLGWGMAHYLGWLATGQVWTGSPVSAYWR